ncbi:MAG: four helix bundle protein [Blastocatellia bacterium]
MKDSPVKNKSYQFAVRVVNLYKHLANNHREFILSGQVLRSGTSIGANVREAVQAESRADFIHKMAISLKEASETAYWLELLRDTKYLDEKSFNSSQRLRPVHVVCR